MTRQTNTDWICEDAEVVEHTYSATGGLRTRTTIVKVTKTQIVLANGRRYSRITLRPVGDKSYHYKLEPADEGN